MKKSIKIVIAICIILILFGMGVFVSFAKFATLNPISSLGGLIEISITNKEYTIIQNNPWKVVISKPIHEDKNAQQILDEYMLENGYATIDRMGSMITYSNGTDEEKVYFSVNKYYSIWEWI